MLKPLFCLTLGLLAASSQAAARLDCQIRQEDRSWQPSFAPVADPYNVKALEINERFHFKAVVIGDAKQVDYIKIYVHYATWAHPQPLYQGSWLKPATSATTSPDALTGKVRLYAPGLEQELEFGCALREVQP